LPHGGIVVVPSMSTDSLDGPPATQTPENDTWPGTRSNYIVAGAFSPTPAAQSITNMMTTTANVTPVQSIVFLFSGVIDSLHDRPLSGATERIRRSMASGNILTEHVLYPLCPVARAAWLLFETVTVLKYQCGRGDRSYLVRLDYRTSQSDRMACERVDDRRQQWCTYICPACRE